MSRSTYKGCSQAIYHILVPFAVDDQFIKLAPPLETRLARQTRLYRMGLMYKKLRGLSANWGYSKGDLRCALDEVLMNVDWEPEDRDKWLDDVFAQLKRNFIFCSRQRGDRILRLGSIKCCADACAVA